MSKSTAPILIVGFDQAALDAIRASARHKGASVQDDASPVVKAIRTCYETFWRHQMFWYPTWDFPEPMLLATEEPSKFVTRCSHHFTKTVRNSKTPWVVTDNGVIGLLPMLVTLWPDLKLLYLKCPDPIREAQFLHDEFVHKMEYVEGSKFVKEDVVVDLKGEVVRQMQVFNIQDTAYRGPRNRFTARCSSCRGTEVLLNVYETAINGMVDVVGKKNVIVADADQVARSPKKVMRKMKWRGWL